MTSLRLSVKSIPLDLKLYGGDIYRSFPAELKAGSLSMHYENGALRYITSGRIELIRMIYSVLRDREWLTVPALISDEKIETGTNSFLISYKSHYRSGDIHFIAKYSITGTSGNSLTFTMEGEALTSFEKNRAGFCILHPIEECSGKTCTIIHSNGSFEETYFPELISPHQPFNDIRAMQWEINGLNCRLDFEGDIFETEDQRNWTDGSYKTYCTPLYLPFPVRIRKGERIFQKIELKVSGDFPAKSETPDTIKFNLFPEKITSIPAIGVGRSSRELPLTNNEIRILRKLEFDHYRFDLHLFENEWKKKTVLVINEAEKLGYSLELALFFDDNSLDQCNDLLVLMSTRKVNISHINIYDKISHSTPGKLAEKIIPILRNQMPGANVACGTNANFAQINRERPVSVQNNYTCYSIHPQEHATDNSTLVENLKAQEYTVKSACEFANGKGIWISPVNIRRRFNANIETFERPFSGNRCPLQVDSRLMSLFGACWTAGSMKYLFESGIKGITYYETAGERGIMQGEFESRWPHDFPSKKDMIFPVYHVFRYILENKSFHVIKSTSSSPLKADLMVLSDGRHFKAILFNLTPDNQEVKPDFGNNLLIISQLDAGTFDEAASDPEWRGEKIKINSGSTLQLKPFSVNFIEGKLREEFLKT